MHIYTNSKYKYLDFKSFFLEILLNKKLFFRVHKKLISMSKLLISIFNFV